MSMGTWCIHDIEQSGSNPPAGPVQLRLGNGYKEYRHYLYKNLIFFCIILFKDEIVHYYIKGKSEIPLNVSNYF